MVKELIQNQIIFARQIMERFGNIPGISWDLDNEPDSAMHQAGDWLNEMKAIWGATGQTVGLGVFSMIDNLQLGEAADWHSIHIPCCKVQDTFHTGKPCILQEAWVPNPSTYEGEDDLEFYLNRGITWTLRYGGAGFMPWNWNMSLMNWRYGGGFVDFWDLQLGTAVHADATPRRGKTILRNWALLLDGISFDQSTNHQVIFIYPRSVLAGKGLVEYLDVLYQKNIPFCAVNDIDLAVTDLSRTQLIIVPLSGLGYRRNTWVKLRQFAENGGVVWAHNDNLNTDEMGPLDYSREIPELAGKENIGKGCFIWCLGWNTDRDKDEPFDPDMINLAQLIDSLPLQRSRRGIIPLVNGEIRFGERLSTNEKTMKADWLPNQKLPDRDVITKVEVYDQDGVLQRAWSENEVLVVDGGDISSNHSLFMIRKGKGNYLITGMNIYLTGIRQVKRVQLIEWQYLTGQRELKTDLKIDQTGDTVQIELEGWQRSHWVEVVV